MLKTMPSIQTRTDVIGATENRPIHPCEARQSGKTSATARQITNRTTSAAARPHPRATILSWLLVGTCVFIVTLLHLTQESFRTTECEYTCLPPTRVGRTRCVTRLVWLVAHMVKATLGTASIMVAASAATGRSRVLRRFRMLH